MLISPFRIIEDETNPVCEETTMVLVGNTDINAEERIKLALVDSGMSFHPFAMNIC